MIRLITSNCRCAKRTGIVWEFRPQYNYPILLVRPLSYYTGLVTNIRDNVCHPSLLHSQFRAIPVANYSSRSQEPLKPSSKVEVAVENIKNSKGEVSQKPAKKPLKERIMDELRHYYHGFRLLCIELKIASGLALNLLKGESLTRREHRLLVRAIGDILRMVPFLAFILVPFLEFLLPIVLKFFPNMLPSTFESKTMKEDKLKKHLKIKLEMAKFFQETLDDMAPQASNRHSELAKEFASFFTKIRTSGDVATSEEIMKFSKLFEDEITLDTLQRPHLVALCKVLNISSIGISAMLRFNLRMKLRSLVADDKMIAKEGVDSLNLSELQQACQARGMRAYGVSEERLRKELRNWLDLSMNEKVPPSLLLLSRALMVPENVPITYKLKSTITALPEDLVTQTQAAIGEKEGKIDFKTKAEIVKMEALMIKQEKQEMQEAERERQSQEAMKRDKEELKDKAPVIDLESTEPLVDPAPIVNLEVTKGHVEEGLSHKDIEIIEDALEKLAQQKQSLLLEKESIQGLKLELSEYKEDVQDLQEIIKTKQADIKLTKGARRLYKAVNNMTNKLDAALIELENKEKELKTTLEQTKTEPEKVKQQLIHIDELMHSIKSLQKVPDEAKLKLIQDVLGRLDDDFDGQLKVDDVMKVLEIIGNENVNLSEKQLGELIELLDKEEILEIESRIQKALNKAAEKQERDKVQGKQSLFEMIREAHKRRELKRAEQPAATVAPPPLTPKTEEIIKKSDDSTRPPAP